MRLLALLALIPCLAFGQGSATLSCTAPTQYTDNTPIGSAPITYRFSRGTTIGTYPTSQTATTCATTFSGLAAGTHYFVARAIVGGVESAATAPVNKLIPGATPNPPTIPQPVSIAGPVFTLLITRDSVVLPEVGSVVAGRPCDPTQQLAFAGNTYMRIDVVHITPFPGQQIEAAWAICGP